ncbi:MAG: Ppx/GppA phosphatase family protein [Pseudomonadota bacterium]
MGEGQNTKGGDPGGGRRDRRPSSRGRRSAQSRGDGPIAALDLGTNNCRLLVAKPDGSSFAVVDAFSRAVRLGEGVEGSNRLSDEAQARALKALRICAGKIRHHRVRDHRIVATEACRRAENGREFVRRVQRETGLQLDIISPEEEARLAVAGCAPLIEPIAEQLLVFDIGGGSTELIWIDMSGTPSSRRESLIRALAPLGKCKEETATARAAAAHIADWISVPMGVSTLHDRFAAIADDGERFELMSHHFEERLAAFGPQAAPVEMTEALQIVGVSGTATTFGALHLGLKSYDRAKVDGLWLPTDGADAVADDLLRMSREGRACHPGIGRGRSELVISGAAILMTILRLWPVPRLRIADRGLREGILYGLIQERKDRRQ